MVTRYAASVITGRFPIRWGRQTAALVRKTIRQEITIKLAAPLDRHVPVFIPRTTWRSRDTARSYCILPRLALKPSSTNPVGPFSFTPSADWFCSVQPRCYATASFTTSFILWGMGKMNLFSGGHGEPTSQHSREHHNKIYTAQSLSTLFGFFVSLL